MSQYDLFENERYTIAQIGPVPGGEGFLVSSPQDLPDGTHVWHSMLADTGFAFAGRELVKNLEEALDGRPLEYIWLSHTHYDHAGGSVYVKERWPEAQVIAGAYAAQVFRRPGALKRIMDMSVAAAAERGVAYDDPDMLLKLSVDRIVQDGDELCLGDLRFSVIETPGHTKCSCALYCASEGLLIGSESTGLPDPVGERVVPSFLVSCQASLETITRLQQLPISAILFPHTGVRSGEEIDGFFEKARYWAEKTRDAVADAYLSGLRGEELIDVLTDEFYDEAARKIQPRAAFRMNASYMIPMLLREHLGVEYEMPHEIG